MEGKVAVDDFEVTVEVQDYKRGGMEDQIPKLSSSDVNLAKSPPRRGKVSEKEMKGGTESAAKKI